MHDASPPDSRRFTPTADLDMDVDVDPSPPASPARSYRATVEDVEDEDDFSRYRERERRGHEARGHEAREHERERSRRPDRSASQSRRTSRAPTSPLVDYPRRMSANWRSTASGSGEFSGPVSVLPRRRGLMSYIFVHQVSPHDARRDRERRSSGFEQEIRQELQMANDRWQALR